MRLEVGPILDRKPQIGVISHLRKSRGQGEGVKEVGMREIWAEIGHPKSRL